MKTVRTSSVCMFIAICVSLWSCTEENITQVVKNGGVIIGRVQSVEDSVVVSAWQAELVKSVVADNEGYFAIDDLVPGIYLVTMEAPSGLVVTRSSVSVDNSAATDIGLIALTPGEEALPFPLSSITPAKSSTNVSPLLQVIWISAATQLDPQSLDDAIEITPAIDGEWSSSGFLSFQYVIREPLQTGTTYTITIGPSLKTPDGTEWGEIWTGTFTTQTLSLQSVDWWASSREYSPTHTGRLMTLRFNTVIETDDLASALSILPPINHTVQPYNGYSPDGNAFEVIVDDGLTPGTDYTITIADNLVDTKGGQLQSAESLSFSTQPFTVFRRSVQYETSNFPPIPRFDIVDYDFNLDVDPATIPGAVSITPHAELTFDIQSPSSFAIEAPEGLAPSEHYAITLSDHLRSSDGTALHQEDVFAFTTQPLRVETFSATRSRQDTAVDPLDAIDLNLDINAFVDIDAFNAATVIDPAIGGFWYAEPPSGFLANNVQTVHFFPTVLLSPIPGTSYSITIDGSADLVGDVGFGADVILSFYVNPVKITRFDPFPGSRDVRTFESPSVEFNAKMDHASTEAAFSMWNSSGVTVPGSINWDFDDAGFRFNPTDGLEVGEVYYMKVTNAAQSTAGTTLSQSDSTFFTVGF